jgi:hypothetical protein
MIDVKGVAEKGYDDVKDHFAAEKANDRRKRSS